MSFSEYAWFYCYIVKVQSTVDINTSRSIDANGN